mmetsp:Transcript_5012/g.12225  ORF Transcript_5012/g.12225 Transcript_5012/m.12225 type:complete len:476 (+) Transcript_5012:71-1498(+)
MAEFAEVETGIVRDEEPQKLQPQISGEPASNASTSALSGSDDASSLSDGSGSDAWERGASAASGTSVIASKASATSAVRRPRARPIATAAAAEAMPAAQPPCRTTAAATAVGAGQLLPGCLSGGLVLRLTHSAIFFGCCVATHFVLGLRGVLARFFRGTTPRDELVRPQARVTWELLSSASDPVQAAKALLPVPPPFPEPPADGIKISFGPCANLMIYNSGVACCLQRCPNYAKVFPRLRFYGVSCGAFVASVMAANYDMLFMMPEMMAWTAKFQGRLWGLIGAYSETISDICWRLFSDPSRYENAKGRLGIGVTAFKPSPARVAVDSFDSANELVTTLLGSCYIPVAFETPQWSEKLGPLWDGGILEFQTHGDIVVSPYENTMPDIFPAKPYPRNFTFFSPHHCDSVRIFEDGYMDCLRWLEAGAPTRAAERDALRSAGGGGADGGIGPLLAEARNFLVDIFLGGRTVAQVTTA